MGRLFLASLFTLTILFSFIAGIVILVLLYAEQLNLELAIGLTIGINFFLWLAGPTITDLINKWFYKVKFLTKEEVFNQYPEIAQIINQVSTQYKFRFPKIGIIPDKNPTAFTYGSDRFNARIVLTEGIFHFLNVQEVKAVVAHELGHIVNRDFIVMMIASTFVQILYEIYSYLMRISQRNRKGKNNDFVFVIASISYVLYLISIYLVFYLSRIREYLADAFSAKITSPQHLSSALIKIAYGIIATEDDNSSKHLLQSTRHLGIIDVKNAKYFGVTSSIAYNNPDTLSEVMIFDKVNPWAKLAELSSTHPLTGNRIGHLSDISKAQGQPFPFNIDAAIERLNINMSRLYSDFAFGLFIMLLPYIFTLISLFFLPIVLLPIAFAFGMLLQIPYRFPFKNSVETTVLEQMRNPYASPIRGIPVSFTGKVIGKGIPGYIFGEDMMYQDSTGLVFLDYTSIFGFIGNIFFALNKIKKLLGAPSHAAGWFYRSMGSMVSLKYLKTEQEMVKSHPIIWAIFLPLILIGISLLLYFVSGFSLPSPIL